MMNGKPLVIDGFCGLGGWTEGFLAEGWECVGIDIERHDYGTGGYPGQLILQDMLTVHGHQFKNADCLVFSPPCQEYSYMAMPWSLAKEKRARILADPNEQRRLTALFDACFRIQREASEAAGRHIPMVVENVKGAQPWVGRAGWHFGSYYLWGDIPALMPITVNRSRENGAKTPAGNCSEVMWKDRPIARLAHATPIEMERHGFKNPGFRFDGSGKSFQSESANRLSDGCKTAGMNWNDRSKTGQDFTRIAGNQAIKNSGGSWFNIAHNKESGHAHNPVNSEVRGPRGGKLRHDPQYPHLDPNNLEVSEDGVKGFTPNGQPLGKNTLGRKFGSKSKARQAASAAIAKIPFVLAQHIARSWKPSAG